MLNKERQQAEQFKAIINYFISFDESIIKKFDLKNCKLLNVQNFIIDPQLEFKNYL